VAATKTNDRVTNDRVTNDRVTNDRVTNDRVTNDRVTNDRVTNDRAAWHRCHRPKRGAPSAARLTACSSPLMALRAWACPPKAGFRSVRPDLAIF
jgi:hypothetical protein